MKEYLAKILPRLVNYSKELSAVEVFVDKPWIFIDEKLNQHEYIFMRDKRLIMSLNGIVITGSWELLPNKKLLVNRVTDQIMLEKMFIDDALLLLKKSGSDDSPFMLINQDVIPDLNAVRYLEGVSQKRRKEHELPDTDVIKILENGSIIGSVVKGQKVISYDGKTLNGRINVFYGGMKALIIVKNNILKHLFYIVTATKDNLQFDIIVRDPYNLEGGMIEARLEDLKIKPGETTHVCCNGKSQLIVVSKDGEIVKVVLPSFRRIIRAILIALFVLTLILYIVNILTVSFQLLR